MTGGIQPKVMSRVASNPELRDNGLLARLLVAMPPRRPKQWSEADVSEESDAAYRHIVERLLSLDFGADEHGNPVPIALPLSPEAKAKFVRFFNAHNREQSLLGDDLSAAWSKTVNFHLQAIKQFCRWLVADRRMGENPLAHLLRHTYLSRLGRSGASPKVMQKLARHSTVELTLGRYTHAGLFDLSSAVNALPPLPVKDAPKTERGVMRATGTDDFSGPSTGPKLAPKVWASGPKLAQAAADARQRLSTIDNADGVPAENDKPPNDRGFQHKSESLTTIEKRRGRDSNPR